MGKYRRTQKGNYIPLNRFAFAKSVKDFPPKLRKQFERKDVKFRFTTTCGVCNQDSLLVFDVENPKNPGTLVICGNPDCAIYMDPEWYPRGGGR